MGDFHKFQLINVVRFKGFVTQFQANLVVDRLDAETINVACLERRRDGIGE